MNVGVILVIFVVGLFIGTVVGVVVTSLMVASKRGTNR